MSCRFEWNIYNFYNQVHLALNESFCTLCSINFMVSSSCLYNVWKHAKCKTCNKIKIWNYELWDLEVLKKATPHCIDPNHDLKK